MSANEKHRVLIASRNTGKIEEIKAVFALPFIEMTSADAIDGLPEVVEDSDTFHGNAVKKAVTIALVSGLWTLSDDSGLEVDALGGAPGVWSARYAGESCDPAANNAKLLDAMNGSAIRSARFRCVIALSSPRGRAQTVEGVCEGGITIAPRGSSGFGYDPVFVPDGYSKTFAELGADVKNEISHRSKALHSAMSLWRDVLERFLPDWPARV